MSTHKHRKGFREDQVMMSEVYSNIYDKRQQLDELGPVTPLAAAGLGALGAMAMDDEEGSAEHVKLSRWWEYDPQDVAREVLWQNHVITGPNHDDAKFWAKIEPMLRERYPKPTEDEEAGDIDIDLDTKDPSIGYEDLEGGEGKYL